MGIYCLTNKKTNPYPDTQLSNFVGSNADSIAANDTDFGFVWDNGGSTTNTGTVATALDGLDASVGGSTYMC